MAVRQLLSADESRSTRPNLMDAGAASQRVRYLSASQFSREYSRFFGNAPIRDIASLRHDADLPA